MKILLPDAMFADPPDLEHGIGREFDLELDIRLYREAERDRVSERDWAEADAALVYHQIRYDSRQFDRMKNLRILVRCGVGYDNIDTHEAARRGLPVCNVPDYGSTDVADTAIGLMLAIRRGIADHHLHLKRDSQARWSRADSPEMGRLRGRNFGVVGAGRIGSAALRRARAFDMFTGFFDPYLPDGAEQGMGTQRFESLAELLGWADVISLHTPLTEETRNLVDRSAVVAMKPGAILINTARGGLVDLDALEAGLREGRIAAAGLDVLPQEPPVPHSLLSAYQQDEDWIAGRLVITPHAAWFSEESRRDMRTKSLRTALRFLREGRLRNCVNLDLLRQYGTLSPQIRLR